MSPALSTLSYVAIFAALLWVPYVLAMFMTRPLMDVFGYPDNPAPLPNWAERAKRAHMNLLENLVPFAALVIVSELVKADAAATASAATIFLYARLVHWLVYVLKVPFLRTLAFLAGVAAMLLIYLEIVAVF